MQPLLDMIIILYLFRTIQVGPIPWITDLFHLIDEVFLCGFSTVKDPMYGLYWHLIAVHMG